MFFCQIGAIEAGIVKGPRVPVADNSMVDDIPKYRHLWPHIHKTAKVDTAEALWVPAISNHGGFGRWAFIEIRDPWNDANEIRAFLSSTDAGEGDQ